MVGQIGSALGMLFQPLNLLLIVIGVGSGILVGALPGLTATMAIALLVPFTFGVAPVRSLVLLGGIYCGAIYGGSFSAILINAPGTPSAIATTFDGYPLAKKGESYRAIVGATLASVIGGLIGVLFLLFLSPVLSEASLKFGPPEFFWLTTFGLTIIATLASKSILNGISLIPALIGFFCVPEIIGMIERREEHQTAIPYKRQRHMVRRVFFAMIRKPFLLIRSAVIGTIVGIIPGAGGNIAGMVSYNEAVRASKKPERFGKGIVDGVVASEASNNAEVSGSLIPLLTLGIPGAPPAAVLLGALLLQGMRPGVELFTVHGAVTYTFILSLILANLAMLPLGLVLGKGISRIITKIPVAVLAPFIFFLSIIGAYVINNNVFDVYLMLFFGLISWVGKKVNFQPGPIVLGLILGSICEQGLVQSILMGRAEGSVLQVFFTRPISIVLILLTIVSALWPFIKSVWSRKSGPPRGAI